MTNTSTTSGALCKATACISVLLLAAACTGESEPANPASNELDGLSTTLDLDLYGRMAAAHVWGSPYIPRISMAVAVDGNQATIAQVSERVARYLAEDWKRDPASFTITELGYLMPTVESAARHPEGYMYPITPVLIIPGADASMDTVRALLDAGAGGYNPRSYVLVAWDNKGTRAAVADIWLSKSTLPNAYRIEDEFYEKAWSADHDILIVGPIHAIECGAPREGLGACKQVEGRSQLTRVGLCGFRAWGEALAAMETRVSRLTEVALLQDCSFLDQQIAEVARQGAAPE